MHDFQVIFLNHVQKQNNLKLKHLSFRGGHSTVLAVGELIHFEWWGGRGHKAFGMMAMESSRVEGHSNRIKKKHFKLF